MGFLVVAHISIVCLSCRRDFLARFLSSEQISDRSSRFSARERFKSGRPPQPHPHAIVLLMARPGACSLCLPTHQLTTSNRREESWQFDVDFIAKHGEKKK